MQNITVRMVNEKYELLESTGINFADVIGGILYRLHDFEKNYPVLSQIDPYGNTLFNSNQIPLALEELRRLKIAILDPKVDKEPFKTNYPGIITEAGNLAELEKALIFFARPDVDYVEFWGD